MASEKLSFTNANGYALAGYLDLPDEGDPVAYALFAHCFTCSKNLRAVGHISKALSAKGFAVLRFDFTGLGESEGDFADSNFSSNVEDLVAASDYLASHFEGPKILIGHSLGGAAVIQAAARIPSAVGVATIGAPSEPDHIIHFMSCAVEQIEAEGQGQFELAGRTFTVKKQFLDDLEQARMTDYISNLKKALIIFHSPIDDVVGIDNAARIFDAARHPKSFISLNDADHLLSNRNDSAYVGNVIAAWSRMYLA
jgi:putative redox protein